MIKQLLAALMTILLELMDKSTFDKFVDMLLDLVEDWAGGDPATPDDDKKIVLALCSKIRALLNVPDND